MKVDGFQIFVAAVLVGHPLAGLARIIEVEHRSHRIHAQAVDVILLQPEHGVRNQERAHLVAPVVEDQRAPVLLLAFARVGVFVERGAVEVDQAVSVAREMRGHPIDNYADARLMAAIDEIHEIFGSAEARRGSEITDHLVAPRS